MKLRVQAPVILNSAGKPIKLNSQERHNVMWMAAKLRNQYGSRNPQTPFLNSLGYEVAITTLTTISKKITEQKFFEIPPADFMAIRVGDAPFSTNITTYRSFDVAEDFETGIINTGGQNSRLATADAAVDALNIKVFPWAKSIGYTIFDLEYAAKSGNWDLVAAKEKSRKRNWDLGIQRIAFLGARGLNSGASGTCFGYLNQPGVSINTTLITAPLKSLDPTDLQTFCGSILEDYRNNCQRTAWPDIFQIPESDYNGLAETSSPTFPIKSQLQVIEEMFQTITKKKTFKIMPCAYGDAQYSGLANQVYTLSRYDEESYRMDVPLDYTTTLANSLDNFAFQNAGYGQFTGGLAYRPLEMRYYQFALS